MSNQHILIARTDVKIDLSDLNLTRDETFACIDLMLYKLSTAIVSETSKSFFDTPETLIERIKNKIDWDEDDSSYIGDEVLGDPSAPVFDILDSLVDKTIKLLDTVEVSNLIPFPCKIVLCKYEPSINNSRIITYANTDSSKPIPDSITRDIEYRRPIDLP